MITSQQVKAMVKTLGGDLCGIANVERFKDAPPRISPLGHLPTAKSVFVADVHTPDGAWELGGEPLDKWGSASVVTAVNSRLERIALYLARHLEEAGYKSIPIPQTAIWRYRPHEELNINFSPDLSHIHAGAAAGLGDIGYQGLLLTPEYGARQRLITIITEAKLDPDPMYNGHTLCDYCMQCVRQCAPSSALRKEVDGMTEIVIDGKKFTYANKNKFRCAWAERFQLRFDIDIPEIVVESGIGPNLACNREGYGSSLEPCWRYCLPPAMRMKKDGRKPNHRKSFWVANPDIKDVSPESRPLTNEVSRIAISKGIDIFGIAKKDDFAGIDDGSIPYQLNLIPHPFNDAWGVVSADPAKYLNDVQTVIVMGVGFGDECRAGQNRPNQASVNCGSTSIQQGSSVTCGSTAIDCGSTAVSCGSTQAPGKATHLIVSGIGFMDEYKTSGAIPVVESAAKEKLMDAILDISRYLEELGYSSVGLTYLSDNHAALAAQVGQLDEAGNLVTDEFGYNQVYTALLTSAPLQKIVAGCSNGTGTGQVKPLTTQSVKTYAVQQGASLVGIASADAFKGIKQELAKVYDEQELGLQVIDRNERMGGHAVDAQIIQRSSSFKDPWDYMPDARSGIVVGTHIPKTIGERAEKPLAESVGVYSMFAQHATWRILSETAFDIVKQLEAKGYKAIPTEDLNGTASKVAHTFGEMVDARANAYAAMLAGLGYVSWLGNAMTPEHGLNQRFFAIVTNADLKADLPFDGPSVCASCDKRCAKSCMASALQEKVVLSIGGQEVQQAKLASLRCDWCKRYAFVGDEGPKYMGSKTYIMPPEHIDGEAIVEAMKKMDPLQKRIPCIVEKCILSCPVMGRED